MPIDAVENIIRQFVANPAMGYQDPAAINTLRESLYELFGLKGSLLDQYISFLKRAFKMDFGISIIAFPSKVSDLISVALPWTISLLLFTTILSWVIGNILGVTTTILESHGKFRKVAKILEAFALAVYPIPYYVMALVLIFLLAYLIRLFPLPGMGGTIAPVFSLDWLISNISRLALPALSILIVSCFGWWFLSARTLTISLLREDFYQYAVIRGMPTSTLLKKYAFKNVLLPQITGLGLSLGSIFGGALIVEAIFGLPGLGSLLRRAVINGDIITSLGILILSIIGVASATYILDIIYPLIDPRVRYR